ncbi:hypothetical protein DFH07DRAFT_772425 [Mycena maculata]|uniref:Uncharacterized protein n=1 Tax=Mycena maculata TaxID=230809 RepID=A0AAD7JAY2_9AGAR|nr:hypothetical protein DFH07DRAFT_772425 [Mycena maculata]
MEWMEYKKVVRDYETRLRAKSMGQVEGFLFGRHGLCAAGPFADQTGLGEFRWTPSIGRQGTGRIGRGRGASGGGRGRGEDLPIVLDGADQGEGHIGYESVDGRGIMKCGKIEVARGRGIDLPLSAAAVAIRPTMSKESERQEIVHRPLGSSAPDIVCATLQKGERFSAFDFALAKYIPNFHFIGHSYNYVCQAKRRTCAGCRLPSDLPGFGRTDGEGVERAWARILWLPDTD